MRLIKLSQGKFAKIDDEDYERVSQFKWSARKDGNTYYATTGGYYKGVNTRKKLHTFILTIESGKMIDHIDGDGLNCQKYNLRSCTNQQNQFNQKKRRNTSCIYKGVRSRKNCNSHEATIRIDKQKVYLGSFKDPKEAARAYDLAALKHFGEFARINNI